MPYKFYKYVALIHPTSKASINLLMENLKQHFSDDKRHVLISEHLNDFVVTIDDYNFKISFQENETVLIESKEIANIYEKDYVGNPIDKSIIKQCKKRFEMGGESDFNMNYFNDSLFIIQCMEELGNITVFNLN